MGMNILMIRNQKKQPLFKEMGFDLHGIAVWTVGVFFDICLFTLGPICTRILMIALGRLLEIALCSLIFDSLLVPSPQE
jgi:hypothetical protein